MSGPPPTTTQPPPPQATTSALLPSTSGVGAHHRGCAAPPGIGILASCRHDVGADDGGHPRARSGYGRDSILPRRATDVATAASPSATAVLRNRGAPHLLPVWDALRRDQRDQISRPHRHRPKVRRSTRLDFHHHHLHSGFGPRFIGTHLHDSEPSAALAAGADHPGRREPRRSSGLGRPLLRRG